MPSACPLCHAPQFEPTAVAFALAETLARWQSEAGVRFRPAVWDTYAGLAEPEVTLHRCGSCRFEMFLPAAAGTAEFYADATAGEYYLSGKWEHYRAIKDIARRKCVRVLDVGCGKADFLVELDNGVGERMQCVGYDINPAAVQAARRRIGPICEGSFPDAVSENQNGQPFDAACAFQVLEHVADPRTLLKQIRSLLRPDGLCILTVPDADGPVARFPRALTNLPPHHVSRWREETFWKAMPGLGFQVLKIRREPLPDYAWPSYLEALWDTNIWPARLCRWLERRHPLGKINRILWFIARAKSYGLRWLWGVPGLSLYVLLEKKA